MLGTSRRRWVCVLLMFGTVRSRAFVVRHSTLSPVVALRGSKNGDAFSDTVANLMGVATRRALATLSNTTTLAEEPLKESGSKNVQTPRPKYRENPVITTTALAHSLWQHVLIPGVDTAIDATCGNGHDSLVLARLLLTKENTKSRLICIDIQEQACEATRSMLQQSFDEYDNQQRSIDIQQRSHAPLLLSSDTFLSREELSLGLVVYNLGYLPNSPKDCVTKLETTISSLLDAALSLRLGGMISVTTYPQTNPDEDLAVRLLLECMALLSSNRTHWKSFLNEVSSQDPQAKSAANVVSEAMELIVSSGSNDQTWRVSEHRKLGFDRAPILLTATRIK